jgi:hypothetical protein
MRAHLAYPSLPQVCRTFVVLTNKTTRRKHAAVCARAVACGAVRVLLDTLSLHSGPEISADVLRVLAQLLSSQRGAATAAEAEEAREHVRTLLAEHADNFIFFPNLEVHASAEHANALLSALALPPPPAGGAASCLACGATTERLKRCSRCKAAQYCSPDCQRRDWPEHKLECRAAEP